MSARDTQFFPLLQIVNAFTEEKQYNENILMRKQG